MLHLGFSNGEINIYTCSVNILKAEVNQYYDWSDDVLNENWNPKKAKQSIHKIPDEMICDVILNQNIFSGVGNSIKNEVFYRCFIHSESLTGKLHQKK